MIRKNNKYDSWRSQLNTSEEVQNYIEHKAAAKDPLQLCMKDPVIINTIAASLEKEFSKLFK